MSEQHSGKRNYAGYPVIRVRILAIRSSRLIVKLEDGRRGIIPKREWTWSPGKHQPSSRFVEGTSIEAVLLPNNIESTYSYLSIRELNDPWEQIDKKFVIGQTVLAEIVNLIRTAAFAEVLPGVTAVIWAKDLPLLPDQIPSDLLSVGDRLYAVITDINLPKKQMGLSANAWFQSLNAAPENQKERLLSLFIPVLDTLSLPEHHYFLERESAATEEIKTGPLERLRMAMVIDDSDADRANIIQQLNGLFQIPVLDFASGRQGVQALETQPEIDLVILDIGLDNGENGADIARDILKKRPGLHILFTSHNPFPRNEILQLEKESGRVFPFVLKLQAESLPKETLAETIRLLSEGVVHRSRGMERRANDTFLDQMGTHSLTIGPLSGNLEKLLENLSKTTFIENAAIVELDSERKEIRLVSAWPGEREETFSKCMDGLYYSQVRDVIEDRQVLYASNLSKEEIQQQFKNFFRFIPFKSCYGVAVRLQSIPKQYGLFVLHDAPDLTWDTIMHIRSTATYAAVIFERESILNLLSKHQDRHFLGQFLGTFIHELGNNLDKIKGDLELSKEAIKSGSLEKMNEKTNNLEETITNLEDLIKSYARVAKDSVDLVNVNDIVYKVIRQLSYFAKTENNIQLIPEVDNSIPEILGNALHLEQIISNVVLNAIQHVSIQSRRLREVNNAHVYAQPLQICRAVLVKTSFFSEEGLCRIAIMDTGPGIAPDHRERIFQAGVSHREDGHGLGLFISRNLTEAMRGHLILSETIRFAGSMFVLSLPLPVQ